MPHFTILTNDDGSVAQILCDGEPHEGGVSFEPPHQIVSAYFKIARTNLDAMRIEEVPNRKRPHGLQAFLMSLTGVEAFANVFFQALARERNDADLANASAKQGPLLKRLRKCLALAFDEPLRDQAKLLDRVQNLYNLRNQIVHPRWNPVSVSFSGLALIDVCQNFQATFEDQDFCEEAFWWCIALVARVGLATGNKSIEGICFHWAGIYGVTEAKLSERLNI